MQPSSVPPFRAEHIGSLLRPLELRRARERREAGALSPEELRAVEDRCVREAIRLQEEIGFEVVTDGEYRRGMYFDHFPAAVSGFTDMESDLSFHDSEGRPMKYRTPVITGRLRRARGISTDDFTFVSRHSHAVPKVTLPSPCSQHYFRWREGVSDAAYPDMDLFFEDVVAVYREEIAELASLGATLIQLDDVSLPLLCDETLRAAFARRGYEPDEWVGRYIDLVNRAVRERPPGVALGIHLCRGNNQGKWLGEGGYDYIADRLFNELEADFFYMEYDSPRAGSFEPLRFLPDEKGVVLGLISSKVPELEDADELCRRVDEAARFVDLERLALSPQCGFASTAPGNPVTVEDQTAKLELTVRVARAVWGD